MKNALLFCFIQFLFINFSFGAPLTWDARLESQKDQGIQFLLSNLLRPDVPKGMIIASPSKDQPNYFFHWVRDAAIVASETLPLLHEERAPRNQLMQFEFAHLWQNKALQERTDSLTGLGEPKFYVNGDPFSEPWGRPQNDGPALRAKFHFQVYEWMESHNWKYGDYWKNILYDGKLPSQSLIKRDVEYVAHHWQEPGFDLWEEVWGLHFYTMISQWKALQIGVQIATRNQDNGAASYYQNQLKALEQSLIYFWDSNKGYIVSSLPFYRPESMNSSRFDPIKQSQLDSSVLLGLLHSTDDFNELERIKNFDISYFESTFYYLHQNFLNLYPVNRLHKSSLGPSGSLFHASYPTLGAAFGRYPEDTYDGYRTDSIGNPWFITTLAAAEFQYRLAEYYLDKGEIEINFNNFKYFNLICKELGKVCVLKRKSYRKSNSDPEFNSLIQTLKDSGESFMSRIIYHLDDVGGMAEQINRGNGYQQGANHLSWNYAAYTSALRARKYLVQKIKEGNL